MWDRRGRVKVERLSKETIGTRPRIPKPKCPRLFTVPENRHIAETPTSESMTGYMSYKRGSPATACTFRCFKQLFLGCSRDHGSEGMGFKLLYDRPGRL